MIQSRRVTVGYRLLHIAAVDYLGVLPDHGAQALVAAFLDVPQQQYSDALQGRRGSLTQLADWCGRFGFTLVIPAAGSLRIDRHYTLRE